LAAADACETTADLAAPPAWAMPAFVEATVLEICLAAAEPCCAIPDRALDCSLPSEDMPPLTAWRTPLDAWLPIWPSDETAFGSVWRMPCAAS
jgi:hypothetical protein